MSKFFTRATNEYEIEILKLPPCARLLQGWLLRRKRPGQAQEFELQEFAEWTFSGRPRPYSIRHIKRALAKLIEVGLVVVLKKYSGKAFKLIADYPKSDKNVTESDKNVRFKTKMSKTETLNPSGFVGLYRENRDTADRPSTHPAVMDNENLKNQEKEQEKVLSTQGLENSDLNEDLQNLVIDAEIDSLSASGEQREILNQIREAIAPLPLNPQLKAVVLQAASTIVLDAIVVLKERKQSGEVKNPAGFLVDAIRGEWKPTQSPSSALAEFNNWFSKARDAGLIQPFSLSSRHLPGLPDGSIGVMRRDSEIWEDWRIVASSLGDF
jgi:hypothetical protein